MATTKSKSKPVTPKYSAAAKAPAKQNYWAEIFLGVIILFVVIIRLRLLGVPLERDEGEYAYFGQLILKGIAPWVEAYNMKFPGTYFAYGFIELIFGQSVTAIHLGLLITNVATLIMVFILAKRFLNKECAVIASAVYAVTSISYTLLGFAAHATHFVMLFAMAGILLLYKAIDKQRMWMFLLAGVLLGCSFVAKQSGVFFTLFGGVLIILAAIERKPFNVGKTIMRELVYGAGAIIPFALTLLILWKAGSLDKFFFWTFKYASAYASQVPLNLATEVFAINFKGQWENFGAFWIIALIGLVVIFFIKKAPPATNTTMDKSPFIYRALNIFFFAFFSFAAICPGLLFRSHYFVQTLPAMAICFAAFGFFLDSIFKSKLASWIKYVVFLIIAAIGINKERPYLFDEKPMRIARIVYGSNPFVEAVEISNYLKQHTNDSDKIAVFGSEPEIYFYSHRRSASGYIYTYNLMEKQPYNLQMQKEMISEVEKSQPKYILMVSINTSWLVQPTSERYIFNWYDNYTKDRYTPVAIMDMVGMTGNFVTENLGSYKPQSKEYIVIFERKAAAEKRS